MAHFPTHHLKTASRLEQPLYHPPAAGTKLGDAQPLFPNIPPAGAAK
jgi:hypothetical protein